MLRTTTNKRHLSKFQYVPEVKKQRDPEAIELIGFLWVVKRYHTTDLTQTGHLYTVDNNTALIIMFQNLLKTNLTTKCYTLSHLLKEIR